MQIPTLSAVVAALMLSSNVVGQLTADQIVSNINVLTAKSQALQAPANSITLISGPLIIVGLGPFPQIIAGFSDIISTATADIGPMSLTAPITDPANAAAIADAFRGFVTVHQQLLSILIGKAGLFEIVPFIGAPVSAVLRSLESIVDTVALGLINIVQTEATSIQAGISSLDGTITTAISDYQGLISLKRDVETRSAHFRALRV